LAGGNKIVVNRGPGGARLVETGHPGARVVSYGRIEDSWNAPLLAGRLHSRTYIVVGTPYAHVYRERHYHGLAYYGYVPGVYYWPGFLRLGPHSLGAPVAYGWGGGSWRHGSASTLAISLPMRLTPRRIYG